MKKFILLLLIPLNVYSATLVFNADFESGTLKGENLERHSGGTKPITDVVTSPVAHGKYAGKYELTWIGSGGVTTENVYRAENKILDNTYTIPFNTEVWAAFNYIYTNWQDDWSAEISPMQIHRVPSDWSKPCGGQVSATSVAPLIMRNKDGKEEFISLGQILYSKPTQKNSWQQVVLRMNIGWSSTNYVEGWRNGVKVFSKNGPNHAGPLDDCGQPWKNTTWNMGIYKWDWKTGRKETASHVKTLYIDDLRICHGSDGYSCVTSNVIPPTDSTPPIITNVNSSNITDSSAKINFTTNEFANSIIDYGLTTSYGKNKTDNAFVTNHSVTLQNLTSNTLYHYRVKSADSYGNTKTDVDKTFTTLTSVDSTHPVISNIASSTTETIANVTWSTDDKATSKVKWWTGVDEENGGSIETPEQVNSHNLLITGLVPNTNYNYKVTSVNANNLSTTSGIYSFTTKEILLPPVISNIVVNPLGISATIEWDTDTLSDSRIDFGLTNSFGSNYFDATPTLHHSIIITGLQPLRRYFYKITSKNNGGQDVETNLDFYTVAASGLSSDNFNR